MLYCRSYFILVWCLILQVSHLDSSGAVSEQPLAECRPECGHDVYCDHKHLDTFPDISTSCRRQVEVLDVGNNKIKTLPQDALAEFTSLETMVLCNNIIQSIPTGAFRDLRRLNELLLQSNNLSSLQPGVFQGLEGLGDRLVLRRNRLTRITRGVFDELESINILSIDDNWIETIEADSFNGMRELGYLHLRHNRIVRLVSGVFSGLGKLKRLYLGNNRIVRLVSGVFSDLGKLKGLYLGNNRIEVIEPGAFEGLVALEELQLSSNRITTLSGIAELHQLLMLDIADNRIKTVDNPSLLDMLHGDFQILISDNPLDCTCKTETLRIWYRQNRESTDDEARCATPAEYLNMTLASIEEPLPACPVTSNSLYGNGNNEEGSGSFSSFVPIIPVAGLLVLALCVFLIIRRHTSTNQPVTRPPLNNNNLEQEPAHHRVDTVQHDGYEPDAYHTFLPEDGSATQVIETPPPSLNGHAFRLSIEDETSHLRSPAPEYLSFDDIDDPRSDEDIQAPLSPPRFKLPASQSRPITRPAVSPRFF